MADYKIGNKSYTGVNKITTKNASGSAVELVAPEGTVNLYSNGTFDVSKFAKARVEVAGGGDSSSPEGDGSIVAGTILSASHYNSGTYPCTGGNDLLSDIYIPVGFKPKVFFIVCAGTVYNGSDQTPYKLSSSICVNDDTGENLLSCSSFLVKGDSTNGWARAGYSPGNGFTATDTGVQGFGSDIKAAKGVTYNWYAWG